MEQNRNRRGGRENDDYSQRNQNRSESGFPQDDQSRGNDRYGSSWNNQSRGRWQEDDNYNSRPEWSSEDRNRQSDRERDSEWNSQQRNRGFDNIGGYGGDESGGNRNTGSGRRDNNLGQGSFGSSYSGSSGYGNSGSGDRPYGTGGYAGDDYGASGYGNRNRDRNNQSDRNRGNNDNDRNWWDRTRDEVSSWFGDDDAERRRRMDEQKDRMASHRGKGPKDYKRSDDRIREDISDRLSDDHHIDASEIDVKVSSCEVTLTGTVDSKESKRRAEDIAESISGVNHVQNNLRVSTSQTSDMNRTGDQSKTKQNSPSTGENAMKAEKMNHN